MARYLETTCIGCGRKHLFYLYEVERAAPAETIYFVCPDSLEQVECPLTGWKSMIDHLPAGAVQAFPSREALQAYHLQGKRSKRS